MEGSVRFRNVAGLMLAMLLTGCTNLPPAEREMLVQAAEEYRRGDAGQAVAKLDRIIRDYDQAVEIAEAYYLRGLCHAKLGQDWAAGRDLEQAVRRSRRPDLTANAQASLAAIAYRKGDWAEAARLYEAAAPDLPDTPPTDVILFRAGVAMQRAGKWSEARRQFARILQKFRDRPVASEARRLAEWRHSHFTIQLAAFGRVQQADDAVRSYRQRGLDPFQENQPRGGSALWVVMTGRYRTWDEAQAALSAVRRVQRDAFVIPAAD